MKNIFQLTMVITVVMMITGCSISEPAQNSTIPNIPNESQQLNTEATSNEQSPVRYETNLEELPGNTTSKDFSFSINDSIITLNDWHNTDDILGTPLSANVITADNADTYTGSFFKTVNYDGFQIKLYSPSQNGKSFSIHSMHAFKEGYMTFKGIEVGDTLEEMQNAYPEIKYDRDEGVYELFDEIDLAKIRFEVKEDLITDIKILDGTFH